MYGFLIDQELVLSLAQALPNAGAIDSKPDGTTEGMVFVGNHNGLAEIRVYANTAIIVSTANVLNIELECYDSDDHANAVSPIDNAHVYLLHKTSADNELSIPKGDLVAAFAIPKDLLNGNKWINLKYLTDEDLSAQKLDAFVHFIG